MVYSTIVDCRRRNTEFLKEIMFSLLVFKNLSNFVRIIILLCGISMVSLIKLNSGVRSLELNFFHHLSFKTLTQESTYLTRNQMLDYTGTQYLESCFQDLNYTPLMKCWFEIFYLIINESYLKFTKIVINNHFTVIDKITIVKKTEGKLCSD